MAERGTTSGRMSVALSGAVEPRRQSNRDGARKSVARHSFRHSGEYNIMIRAPQSRQEVLRETVKKLVQQPVFDYFMAGLVVVYTVVVFTQIIVDDDEIKAMISNYQDVRQVLIILDFITIFFFLIEIMMKVFVFGLAYFEGWLYVIDACTVVISLIFGVLEVATNNEQVAKVGRMRAVARLVRLIIMFRRVEDKYFAHVNDGSMGISITSPVERVLDMLNDLKENRELTRGLRRDIVRAIQIVASNKLYEPVFEEEGEGEEDAVAWINTATVDGQERSEKKTAANVASKGESGSASTPVGPSPRVTSPSLTSSHSRPSAFKGAPVALGEFVVEGGVDEDNGTHFEVPRIAPELVLNQEALDLLSDPARFDFDVWDLARCTDNNALLAITTSTLEQRGIFADLGISTQEFRNFVYVVQQTYQMPLAVKERESPFHPELDDGEPLDHMKSIDAMLSAERQANPYHNAVHAADVVQTSLFMLYGANLRTIASLSVQDIFAAILAGTIHDYGHPGFNNMYCSKTQHPLAIRYNDKAVLEMHHVASAYWLIHSDAAFRFFNNVPDSTYIGVRDLVLSMVLSTDMATHFSELGRFKSRIQAGDFLARDEATDKPQNEDKVLACNVMMHACDISNPAKALDVYLDWTTRVLWEFFAQGDYEKSAGVAVSMFMDRETTNIAKCQLGFLDILVLPLFDALTIMLPECTRCVENLSSNKEFWKDRVEPMEEERVSGLQRMPSSNGGTIELRCENNEFSTIVHLSSEAPS